MLNVYDIERYKVMRNLIEKANEKTVLDLGAGSLPLSADQGFLKVTKVDGDSQHNADIIADLNEPFPMESESYDLVIAGEIIEHVINPFRFLLDINRVLKMGGEVILSTPNICSLKNRFLVFFGQKPANACCPHPIQRDHIFFHKSDFTKDLIIEFLEKAGFRIDVVTSSGIFFRNKKIIPGSAIASTLGEILIIRAVKIREEEREADE